MLEGGKAISVEEMSLYNRIWNDEMLHFADEVKADDINRNNIINKVTQKGRKKACLEAFCEKRHHLSSVFQLAKTKRETKKEPSFRFVSHPIPRNSVQ